MHAPVKDTSSPLSIQYHLQIKSNYSSEIISSAAKAMEITTTTMKLWRAASLATSAAMAVATDALSSPSSLLPQPPQWYSNWAGGTNICLPDTSSLLVGATSYYSFAASAGSSKNDFLLDEEPPAYLTQQNLMKDGRDECCDSCYWWDMADCVEGSPVLIIGDDDDGGGSISSSVASGNFGGHEEIVYSEGGLGGVGKAENSTGSGVSVADGESESGEADALDDNAINDSDDAAEGEDIDGGPSALAGDAGEVEQQQQTQQT